MSRRIRNILFVMYDQLRWDYLSCAGHPHLHTPHFDGLAARGVRFTRAYVQSPVCGSSRMSTYTGRYPHSHGAQWNGFPLKVGEQTMGDHLRALGWDCWLIGKTHMVADAEGMERLGISQDGIIGTRLAECGFDTWVRDDGLWGQGPDGFYDERRSPYNEYLKARGYPGENPWQSHANAGVTEDGEIASGWFMEHARKPANVAEEDSETPWLTSRAIDFMEANAQGRWLAHVSYIKPHWPYIVPAPYHAMFGPEHVPAPHRSKAEREGTHPVLAQYQDSAVARAFRRQDVRETAIPAYMGLIKQCDDQLGRLLAYLEDTGRMEDTMIVLTSDHGDYLGDHWMGEKDFFHECSVKVPMIVYDPRAQADAARGTTCDALVEAIDLAPTFLTAAGGEVPEHILEGRDLTPFLHGQTPDNWREVVISEYDFSVMPMAANLGFKSHEARLFMVFDGRYKLIHSEGPGMRPLLFDLAEDPDEFHDLGASAAHSKVIDRLYGHLAKWARRMSQRTTRSEADLDKMRGRSRRRGILLGLWDGSEVPDELTEKYRGPADGDFTAKDSPGPGGSTGRGEAAE